MYKKSELSLKIYDATNEFGIKLQSNKVTFPILLITYIYAMYNKFLFPTFDRNFQIKSFLFILYASFKFPNNFLFLLQNNIFICTTNINIPFIFGPKKDITMKRKISRKHVKHSVLFIVEFTRQKVGIVCQKGRCVDI